MRNRRNESDFASNIGTEPVHQKLVFRQRFDLRRLFKNSSVKSQSLQLTTDPAKAELNVLFTRTHLPFVNLANFNTCYIPSKLTLSHEIDLIMHTTSNHFGFIFEYFCGYFSQRIPID